MLLVLPTLQLATLLTTTQSELGPVNVALNVALHKILSVDLYGGTLRAAVWLRQEWDDPRLTWNKQEWNVSKVWFANDQQGDTEIWQVRRFGGLLLRSNASDVFNPSAAAPPSPPPYPHPLATPLRCHANSLLLHQHTHAQPDIALWNAANPILYTLSQEPLAVNSSGRVFWSRPGFFEVACNFKVSVLGGRGGGTGVQLSCSRV
jgi:hypothetical protein